MITKTCLNCRNEFRVYPSREHIAKFCSYPCSVDYKVGDKNPNYRGGKQIICKCGKPVYKAPYQDNRFCSHKCYAKNKAKQVKGENNPNFRGWKSKEKYNRHWRKKFKEQFLKRDRFRCQQCFRHQNELNKPLEVHHIDYNKTNDSPRNLITLCNSCHLQTNFQREDWEGYFQNKMQEAGL